MKINTVISYKMIIPCNNVLNSIKNVHIKGSCGILLYPVVSCGILWYPAVIRLTLSLLTISFIGELASKYFYSVVLYAFDILPYNAPGVWGQLPPLL